MPCLGIVGTLVWDRIHPEPEPGGAAADVHEDWGGIVYSFEAFEAARPVGWTFLPIAKVGADLFDPAIGRVGAHAGACGLHGLRRVSEPNNRVDLHYHDRGERCEHLQGGVPGWTWEELEPLVAECDAVYVNFISGWELDLSAARHLRREFDGPIYGDLHSLLLGVDGSGVRVRQPLPEWERWVECFDWLQGNEDEVRVVSGCSEPLDGARTIVAAGARGAFVTLGSRGAAWATAQGEAGVVVQEALEARASAERPAVDPTGCGDVWGGTCVAELLAGRGEAEAVRRANAFAAAAAAHRGTAGLASVLSRPAAARHAPT
jgi:sugar/nucleoside kinase (ribokinase family)